MDEYHVVHRVWKVTDAQLIQRVLDAMKDKWLLIADGHHRYETSVAYMHERAEEQHIDAKAAPKMTPDGLPQPAFPEQAMMMTFVNMDAPGITILPTHRVVSGIEGFSLREFAESAKQYFDVKELAGSLTPLQLLAKLNETEGVAFVAATREGNLLLTPKAGGDCSVACGAFAAAGAAGCDAVAQGGDRETAGDGRGDGSQGREDSLLPRGG